MTARQSDPEIRCPFCDGTWPTCCVIAEHYHRIELRAIERRVERQLQLANAAAQQQRYSVDFIARFADAWNLKGPHILRASRVEHRVLLELAGLPSQLCSSTWEQLEGAQRESLLWAAKAAIALGKQCAWIYGA